MASVWRGCSEPAAGAPGRFGLRAAGDPGCELAAAGKRGSGWAGKCSNGAGRGYNVSAWASGIQGRGVTEEVGTPGRGLTMGGGILRRGAREGGGTPGSIGRDRLEGGWILGMGLMEAVGTPEREIMEGDGILERWTSEGGRVSPRCQTMGYVGTGATWCLVLGRFGVGRSNLSPVFLKPACSQITNIIRQGPLKVVGLEFLPRCTWALGTTIAPMREAQFGSSARRSWPHLWAKPTHGHLQLHPWARAVSTDVPQDVLLFQHHRPIYFRLLGLFCGAQSLFWAYLAFIAFTSLKDTGCKETVLIGDQAQGLPKIRGMALNLGADKWRYGFTASCLTMDCSWLPSPAPAWPRVRQASTSARRCEGDLTLGLNSKVCQCWGWELYPEALEKLSRLRRICRK
ncbi:transmembrane protein 223 isoform X2 [Narcine bancroftii]|uniref:transmembrane protein 223 isoform X2 n=1 Tax=Narcine bancroftii TaxID=1343680 RepID=UPI0038321E9B